jgi:glycosyltransferase involved in cell wall biosynthesis
MQPSPAPSSAIDIAAAQAGWRMRVESTTTRAASALAGGDMRELERLFDELEGWDDAQRAYQARCRLAELVLAYRPQQADAWVSAFVTASKCLLDALARTPSEPVLLNLTGVLLYELTELGGAEALFRAAIRLDPELPHVAQNLDHALVRKRGTQARPRGAAGAMLRTLGKRAKAVAGRARPRSAMTLSLCMIVKDEEEMLPGCLEAVRDAVDEMIVVDTGSGDRTAEIARSFGAKVIDFPWNGSFADARNVSLEAATGDWVMYLDADEHMIPEDAAALRELLSHTWREAFYLVETNYTGGDESGNAVTHHALRVWRNRPDYRFEGRIHEQKSHTMPTYLPERFETSNVRIRHYGYLRSRIASKDKSRRNIELLEIEARENPSPFNDYNLGSEFLALNEPARAREHFDRAWEVLREEQRWQGAGYAPMLMARVVTARRGAGDFDAARAAIAEGLEIYPDHTDLVLEQALCAQAEGDLRGAAELARRCMEMGDAPTRYAATVGSGTFLAMTVLAEIERAQGRPDVAEKLYRRSLADHPEYAAPVLPLITLMLERGSGAAELQRVVPARPSARLLAATSCYESGRNELAELWFRDVLDVQPGNGVARIGLVETLLSASRFGEAAAEAALEPADSPVAGQAAAARLFALAASGDGAAMDSALAEAEPSLAPHDADFYRGWAAALNGRPLPAILPAASAQTAATVLEALLRVQAIEAFAQVLPLWQRLDQNPRDRAEALAWIYFRRGFLDSAADEWIAVASSQPDVPSLMGLSQVALARGMHQDAAVFAAEAAALDPRHPEAAALSAAIKEKYPQAS